MGEVAAAPRKKVSFRQYLTHLTEPVQRMNPITVQILGICSALAVTVKLKPALFMAGAVLFVLVFSNFLISLLRNTIPHRIRMIVELVVISFFVILVDEVLRAFAYDVSKQLSVFVGLIITNCIIMGRLEAFAMGNKPLPSILDGIGNALGYGIILIMIAVVRELLGSGTLLGWQVIPASWYELGYINNGLMVLPPSALLVLGTIVWLHRAWNKQLIDVS